MKGGKIQVYYSRSQEAPLPAVRACISGCLFPPKTEGHYRGLARNSVVCCLHLLGVRCGQQQESVPSH